MYRDDNLDYFLPSNNSNPNLNGTAPAGSYHGFNLLASYFEELKNTSGFRFYKEDLTWLTKKKFRFFICPSGTSEGGPLCEGFNYAMTHCLCYDWGTQYLSIKTFRGLENALASSENNSVFAQTPEDVWMFADADSSPGKGWIVKGSGKNISSTRHNGIANFVTVTGSVMSEKVIPNYGNATKYGYALPQKHWLYHDN